MVLLNTGCDTNQKKDDTHTELESDIKDHLDVGQEIIFPRSKKRIDKYPVHMAALLEGQLVLNGLCLQVKTVYPDHTISYHTPIWTYDIRYEIENGILLLKKKNQIMATLGKNIKLGGGETYHYAWLENHNNLHKKLSQCSAPYWIAHFSNLQ